MRKFVKMAFVAAFAAVAGYGVYTSQKTSVISDLVLADVEAVAGCEVSASGGNTGACVKDVSSSKEYCASGGWGPSCSGTI